jgi:hypothetical protein
MNALKLLFAVALFLAFVLVSVILAQDDSDEDANKT